MAAFFGHLELVQLLLANGASRSSTAKVRAAPPCASSRVNQTNGILTPICAPQNGTTALDAAGKSGSDEVVFALLTLLDAVKRGDPAEVEQILTKREDVDVDECVPASPFLSQACRCDRTRRCLLRATGTTTSAKLRSCTRLSAG